MTSRTITTSVAGRSSSMRRQRRRVAATRQYCRTNGCASFLRLDPTSGAMGCQICGYALRAA